MFGKLFGKKGDATDGPARKAVVPDDTIEKARASNPVAPLKIGAEELVERLVAGMKTERGVHVESLLAALGSLAGFCCVDSALKQAAALGRSSRECGIVDVEMADGTRYYLGNPINHLLGESELSLWSLVAGMVNHLGSQDYPDFGDIAAHVAGTLGKPEFGIPRVPEAHRPGDLPINYVRHLWPHVLPLVERRAPLLHERVTLFGFGAQNVMQMGKDVIPPAVAGKLVMECSVPMSKLDPATLW